MPEPIPASYALDDNLLHRPAAAARKLDVSLATLKRLISSGELPSVKIGSSRRVAAADLAAYVERLRTQQSEQTGHLQ